MILYCGNSFILPLYLLMCATLASKMCIPMELNHKKRSSPGWTAVGADSAVVNQ